MQIGQQIREDRLDHALIRAVKKLDAPALNRLLDAGASANACDTCGLPLTFTKLVMRLLARIQHRTDSANSNSCALRLLLQWLDNHAFTPEDIAKVDAMSVALIQHGANIRIPVDDHGLSPLYVAANFDLHHTVRLLLSKRADADSRDDFGMTPLMAADAESTALLLEHGADANAMADTGITPLFCTLGRGDPACFRLLIEHGANVNPCLNNHTPLYEVIDGMRICPNKDIIIGLLKDHGAVLTMNDRRALAQHHLHEE